jgi:AraC-like DNA-binding protein
MSTAPVATMARFVSGRVVPLKRLESSTEDLSRIALDLGFDSHSHFSRHFRARFGVAPSRVRADLRALGRLRLKERDSGGARRR